MVLVQMSVKVSDVQRFMEAAKKYEPIMAEAGARNQRILTDESDPDLVSSLSEWESHDAMHKASEEWGDRYNADAGTEGLQWETHIWHIAS